MRYELDNLIFGYEASVCQLYPCSIWKSHFFLLLISIVVIPNRDFTVRFLGAVYVGRLNAATRHNKMMHAPLKIMKPPRSKPILKLLSWEMKIALHLLVEVSP